MDAFSKREKSKVLVKKETGRETALKRFSCCVLTVESSTTGCTQVGAGAASHPGPWPRVA
eukprot:4265776-Prymnesium_polylepis.1